MTVSRWTQLVSAVALFGSLALAVAACGSSSRPRADLLFVSSQRGDYEIFVMKADGSGQRTLKKGPGDGSTPRKLFYQVDPAWSPDGRRIAFASTRDGSFDIFLIDADGSHNHRITSTSAEDKHPSWSPDGKRIVFVRGSRIDVMNADGTAAHSIDLASGADADPAWSPDGRWIAYVRRSPGVPEHEIWLVRPDGTRNHALTSLRASSDSPAWSPDGKRLVFSSNPRGGNSAIYTIGLNGKGLHRLTISTDDEIDPAWSPDGKTIAFARAGAIVLYPLGPGTEDTITDAADNDSSPAWNPVTARAANHY